MRKPLSEMTDQQFVETMACLGLTHTAMAAALGKSQPTISKYANGWPIPLEIAHRLGDMVKQRREQLAQLGYAITAASTIHNMIVVSNEIKRRDASYLHRTADRFMNRQRKPDTTPYPVFRLPLPRWQTYVAALASWHAKVVELARTHSDAERQRDYRLEAADLKALAANTPRHAPYDIYIERCQWLVVSRALRHAGTPEAMALWSLWNKHKGAGYPRAVALAKFNDRATIITEE